MNAAGVLQIPLVMSIWDDGYGISVPQKYHTTKESISKVLAGLQRTKSEEGFEIFKVNGWDYPALIKTYQKGCKNSARGTCPMFGACRKHDSATRPFYFRVSRKI